MSLSTANLNDPRLHAAMQAALARIKHTVAEVADRVVDALGIAALQAVSGKQRDSYLGAQTQLQRRLGAFHAAFVETLEDKVDKEISPRQSTRGAAPTDWQSLSLVDDKQVEELVNADRLGQAIAHDCEWEVRELDGYFGAMLRIGRAEKDRNPLRPEVLGKALFRAIEAASEDDDARRLLATEFGRALSQAMRACYAEVAAELRARGIHPVAMSVKTVEGPGHDYTRSGYDSQRQGIVSSFEETLGLPGDSAPMTFVPSGSGCTGFTRGQFGWRYVDSR